MVVLPKLAYKYNAIAVKHKQYYFVLFGFILELENMTIKFTWKINLKSYLEKPSKRTTVRETIFIRY